MRTIFCSPLRRAQSGTKLVPCRFAAQMVIWLFAAVMLTLRHREGVRSQDPSWQARVRASDRLRMVKMAPTRPTPPAPDDGGQA